MQFRLTFHIKLVLFKNIDIRPIYGLKSTKFHAYSFLAYNLVIFSSIRIKKCVYKFRRPLAGSRAPKIWVLVCLSDLV